MLHRFTQRHVVAGGTISAARRNGRSNSAMLVAQAPAPTTCGLSWPRADDDTVKLELRSERRGHANGNISFDPLRLPPETKALREEVRAFIAEEIAAGTFDPQPRPQDHRSFNRSFRKKVGAKGWIGMTWPKQYGGQERSFLDRYVVTEEFRAVDQCADLGAFRRRPPERAGHPQIRQREELKQDDPAGHLQGRAVAFCIGMSEPGSGSDLFAASAKADKADRRLAAQRRQDLDLQRAPGRLHDRAVPDIAGDQGKPAARPDPVSRRHEDGPASRSTRSCR